jgi:hypothetical protein
VGGGYGCGKFFVEAGGWYSGLWIRVLIGWARMGGDANGLGRKIGWRVVFG